MPALLSTLTVLFRAVAVVGIVLVIVMAVNHYYEGLNR